MTSGGRETLAQRVANTGARQGHGTEDLHGTRPVAAPWTASIAVASSPMPPPVRHCWYDGPHGRQAALLLGWRKVADGYDGRIAVVVRGDDGWVLVEIWVDQGMLRSTLR